MVFKIYIPSYLTIKIVKYVIKKKKKIITLGILVESVNCKFDKERIALILRLPEFIDSVLIFYLFYIQIKKESFETSSVLAKLKYKFRNK